MNTRLQVEHPVTEAVFGVDLVEKQLAVAEGHPLRDDSQEPLAPHGHAVEVRLYAEDPARDWQPQSGLLTAFDLPDEPGLRVDAGYAAGSTVSTHYDAMLAKVVAHAPTRDQAVRLLAGALARARVHGVTTNRDLLERVLRSPAFLAGEVSTDFLERHDLRQDGADDSTLEVSAFAAAVALAEHDAAGRTVQRRVPVGWRNVVSAPLTTRFDHRGEEVVVRWYGGREGYTAADLDVRVAATESSEHGAVIALESTDKSVRRFEVYVAGDAVDVESSLGHVALRRTPRFVDPADQVATGSLLAPMPGAVVSVAVEPGAEVAAGAPVLVLEAMKMQHTVAAPHAGTVTEIPVSVGDQVAAGDVLAVVSTDAAPEQGEES
jgi:propionyl-CoA carboxylase alpha chain